MCVHEAGVGVCVCVSTCMHLHVCLGVLMWMQVYMSECEGVCAQMRVSVGVHGEESIVTLCMALRTDITGVIRGERKSQHVCAEDLRSRGQVSQMKRPTQSRKRQSFCIQLNRGQAYSI